MTRIPRSVLPDGIYHVTARGVDRCAIYRDDQDRRLFLRFVLDAAKRFRWTFHALCLMGNHYHLVFLSTRAALSTGMQGLNGRYAQAFNVRHARRGHLFGDRFDSRVVEDDAYLEALCVYVANNPVRAGLCEQADEWPWSWSRYRLDA